MTVARHSYASVKALSYKVAQNKPGARPKLCRVDDLQTRWPDRCCDAAELRSSLQQAEHRRHPEKEEEPKLSSYCDISSGAPVGKMELKKRRLHRMYISSLVHGRTTASLSLERQLA